jgi:phosphoserine phosphatase RsbU/P
MTAKINRLTEKLKVKDFKLNALLNTTVAINRQVETEELLGLYQETLQIQLGIEKVVLFVGEGSWKCLLKYGVEGDVGDITDRDFFNSSSTISLNLGATGSESFDIVIPVYQDTKPMAYLLVGDVGEDKIRVSPVIKHMNFLQTYTNLIVVAIQNKKLAEERLVQVRVNKELELAAEMQAILVPRHLPKNERFEVAAVYKPHQQVGGDYYDLMVLGDSKVMMCMADVSGKGVSAAFLMANFQAYLRALFTYKTMPLAEVIVELNERVMSSAMGEKYITFFIAIYDEKTRGLEYVNCGHNPPFLVRKSGSTDMLIKGSIGLGMFEEIPTIEVGLVNVAHEDVLVCYTDGLVELENEAKEEYSLEKLEHLVRENFTLSMTDLTDLITNDLEAYRGEMPYIDDTAILSCRFF